jgi:catechol 2,3-dioxygenase-like lactoylglutathione lyase family enzyme
MTGSLTHARTLIAFLIGLALGGAVMTVAAQSNRIAGNNGVNHVGINVANMNEAISFYGKNFGFGEAAVIRDDKGQATLAFIQVSRNTFIELGPATAERPAGINHFGIHVDDLKAATGVLRQRGVKIDDPRGGRTAIASWK